MDKFIYVELEDGSPIILNFENIKYFNVAERTAYFTDSNQELTKLILDEKSMKRVIKELSTHFYSVQRGFENHKTTFKYDAEF